MEEDADPPADAGRNSVEAMEEDADPFADAGRNSVEMMEADADPSADVGRNSVPSTTPVPALPDPPETELLDPRTEEVPEERPTTPPTPPSSLVPPGPVEGADEQPGKVSEEGPASPRSPLPKRPEVDVQNPSTASPVSDDQPAEETGDEGIARVHFRYVLLPTWKEVRPLMFPLNSASTKSRDGEGPLFDDSSPGTGIQQQPLTSDEEDDEESKNEESKDDVDMKPPSSSPLTSPPPESPPPEKAARGRRRGGGGGARGKGGGRGKPKATVTKRSSTK